MPHLQNHIKHHELENDSTLHVVGVISNYAKFHTRYRLYRDWLAEMESTPNVAVYTVETAFGDRKFEVTDPNNPRHLQLRTDQEIWNKENMINLGVKYLVPRTARYLCWSDCDISFENKDTWALETIHMLQHFALVQPWSDCIDLGPKKTIYQTFKSFGFQHQRRIPKQMHPSQPYQYAHSGFAWACTRNFWEAVGGLPDFCILGSADHHSAFAAIGEVLNTIPKNMKPSFARKLVEWQSKATLVTKGEVGFVACLIKHFFHGPKARRKYRERWPILSSNGYDPDTDLMYDHQGVIKLIGKPKLLHDIHNYNVERIEDSTEAYL